MRKWKILLVEVLKSPAQFSKSETKRLLSIGCPLLGEHVCF
jgi:hypothetical protein